MIERKIRVFCVDDHQATTDFYELALNLEPDMEHVGSHDSTEGLLAKLEEANPSVLLLDLLIPGCDSLEALAQIRARFPTLVILVASGLDENYVVEEAFRRGASGFYLKTMDFAELTAMIRRAAAGERVRTGLKPIRPPKPGEDPPAI